MKKRIFTLLLILLMLLVPMEVYSKSINPYGEPTKIRCTCYTAETESAITRDGSKPIEGYCAGRYEDLGKVAILYQIEKDGSVGELIGFFEFRDTGGHKGLKNGSRIDIYRDSLDRCYDWVNTYGDYVYIQIVDCEG